MQNAGFAPDEITYLEAELESLTHRLQDGENRIDAALARGEDVSAWEEFWLRLLHEYEALYERINNSRTAAEHTRIAA